MDYGCSPAGGWRDAASGRVDRWWKKTLRAASYLLAGVIVLSSAPGLRPARGQSQDVKALREEMTRLRADYERRLKTLDARLQALEAASKSGTGGGSPQPAGADELEALRAAARTEAGVSPAGKKEAPAASFGHERNLQRLNPEISFTGDVVASLRGASKTFDPREFELDLQAALDPFSSTKLTLSFADGQADVEEGYVVYTGLARGLRLRAGKMRQSFGVLNRFHQHALPQVDYPLVLRTFFGSEGLDQTGVSFEWSLPRPWASANELTLQVTDGAGEPFGGGNFKRPVLLGRLKNYWDLSPSTYLEWGLSGVGGREAPGRDSLIWGTDLTVHWQPPSRAKYREITWRTEALLSQRHDADRKEHDAGGLYSYIEGLVRRNLYAGLSYNWVEDPFDPAARRWTVSPYMTWWQSEYVRLRGEYRLIRNAGRHRISHGVFLQLTWAAGPHKHENY